MALTPRETEVVWLLRDGLTTAQAADELGLSVRTIEDHLASIRAKTGQATTVAAVHHARVRARPRGEHDGPPGSYGVEIPV